MEPQVNDTQLLPSAQIWNQLETLSGEAKWNGYLIVENGSLTQTNLIEYLWENLKSFVGAENKVDSVQKTVFKLLDDHQTEINKGNIETVRELAKKVGISSEKSPNLQSRDLQFIVYRLSHQILQSEFPKIEAWNQIVSLSENEILAMDQKEREEIFNDAISYLCETLEALAESGNPEALAVTPEQLLKFIRCIPAKCVPDLGSLYCYHNLKALFLEENLKKILYESAWKNPFATHRVIRPEFEKAVEDHIKSGNNAMALFLLNQGIGKPEVLNKACKETNFISSLSESDFKNFFVSLRTTNQNELFEEAFKKLPDNEDLPVTLDEMIEFGDESRALKFTQKWNQTWYNKVNINSILLAYKLGKFDVVRNLIDSYVIKNYDETPFYRACINKENEHVNQLLKIMCELNIPISLEDATAFLVMSDKLKIQDEKFGLQLIKSRYIIPGDAKKIAENIRNFGIHSPDSIAEIFDHIADHKIALTFEFLKNLDDTFTTPSQRGGINELSTFGRGELIAPFISKAIRTWNTPSYKIADESLFDINLPWKYLVREILIGLVLKGVDQSTLQNIVGEIEKNPLFKDGKKVQIFIDILIQLNNREFLTPQDIKSILERFIKESQLDAQKVAKARAIAEGKDAKIKLSAAKEANKSLKGKKLQDCNAKIKLMEAAENEETIEPTKKEIGTSYSLTMGAILALFGFENGVNKIKMTDIAFKEILYQVFKETLTFGQIDDFTAKYNKIFIESRYPDAFVIYMSKLKSLNDPVCMEYLQEFLTHVLNGTFAEWRYSLDNNPHLTAVNKADPKLIEKWKQKIDPLPIDSPEDSSMGVLTHDSAVKFLKENFLNIEPNKFDYLKRFAEGDEEGGQKVRDECSKAWDSAKKDANYTKAAKNDLKLQMLLFQFMETKTSAKQLGLLRTIVDLLNEAQFSQIKTVAVKDIEERMKLLRNAENEICVAESDDPIDILLCGTEVMGSCQIITGEPTSNQGLLGYIGDGKIKLLVIKNTEGKIEARCLIRILLKDGKPVLFRDLIYSNSNSPLYVKAFNKLALKKAESLGIQAFSGADNRNNNPELTLNSLKGPAPCEYCDGAGGVYKNGEYTIRGCTELIT